MARLPSQRSFVVQTGDDATPNFDILISGIDATGAGSIFEAIRPLIASVVYEEDEEMASMMEMAIINQPEIVLAQPVNWNAVIDHKAFQEGNAIDLYMGYGGVEQFVGTVETVKWLPRFPSRGPSSFTLKGFDGRHRMTLGNQHRVKQSNKDRRRKTFYRGLPDELIVKKIAEKYGYGVSVDTTERKHKKVSKPATHFFGPFKDKITPFGTHSTGLGDDVSKLQVTQAVFPTRVQPAEMRDWAFLRKLADINRFDLWVEWDHDKDKWMVHFKKRADAGQANYLFTYNGRDGSLIEAEPDFSIQDQPTDVEVLYYDKKRRAIERTVINDLNPSENVSLRTARRGNFEAQKTISKGARVRFSAFGQTIEALSDKPFRNKKEADTFVKNWLSERERDFLTLRGRVVGVETLKPRQIHQFEGMGKRLDGFYRLTQVRHEMAPGSIYECDFVAHKVLSQDVARRKATTRVQSRAIRQASG